MDRQLFNEYARVVRDTAERYNYIIQLKASDEDKRQWLHNLLDEEKKKALRSLEAAAVDCPTCGFPLLLSPLRAHNHEIGIDPYCISCKSGHQVPSEQDEEYTRRVMRRLQDRADNFWDRFEDSNWATSDSIKRKGFFKSMFW